MPSRASPLSRLTYRRGGDEVGVDRAQASPSPSRTRPRRMHGNGLFQTRESAGAINRLLFSPSEAQFEAVPSARPPRCHGGRARSARGFARVPRDRLPAQRPASPRANAGGRGDAPVCRATRYLLLRLRLELSEGAAVGDRIAVADDDARAGSARPRPHRVRVVLRPQIRRARRCARRAARGRHARRGGKGPATSAQLLRPPARGLRWTDPRTRSRCSATPPRTSAVTDWWR